MKNLTEFEKLLTDFETETIDQTEFIKQIRLFVKESNSSIYEANNPLDNLFNLDNKANLLINLDTLFFSFLETHNSDELEERERILTFYREIKTIINI